MHAFKRFHIQQVRRTLAWQAGALAALGATIASAMQAVWLWRFAPGAQIPFSARIFASSLAVAAFVGVSVHWLVSRALSPRQRLAGKDFRARLQVSDLPPQAILPAEIEPSVDGLRDVLVRHEKTLVLARSVYVDLNHDLRTPLHNLTLQAEVTLMARRSVEEYEALLRSNLEEFMRLATVADRTLRALRELASQTDAA